MEAHVDHMTLAKLHPDIMRNIILVELESVDKLRLASGLLSFASHTLIFRYPNHGMMPSLIFSTIDPIGCFSKDSC